MLSQKTMQGLGEREGTLPKRDVAGTAQMGVRTNNTLKCISKIKITKFHNIQFYLLMQSLSRDIC